MTRTVRRQLRLAASGLCLLSLLASAGEGWVWWRSYRGSRVRVSFLYSGDRYTFRTSPGRMVLFGPPPQGALEPGAKGG